MQSLMQELEELKVVYGNPFSKWTYVPLSVDDRNRDLPFTYDHQLIYNSV